MPQSVLECYRSVLGPTLFLIYERERLVQPQTKTRKRYDKFNSFQLYGLVFYDIVLKQININLFRI